MKHSLLAGDLMVQHDQGLLKKQCPLHIGHRSRIDDFGDVADVGDVGDVDVDDVDGVEFRYR